MVSIVMAGLCPIVLAGLVPAIRPPAARAPMAGTSPAMTIERSIGSDTVSWSAATPAIVDTLRDYFVYLSLQ
jgi:hypothetical protein